MNRPLRFLAILTITIMNGLVLGQNNDSQGSGSSLCVRDSALQTIQQQLAATKLIENRVQRIRVLIRGADLVWPYQEERSRAAFAEAFELARTHYEERGDESQRERFLIISVPDPRFTVINSISKRDPDWARKLTEQMLDDGKREIAEKTKEKSENPRKMSDRLLDTASQLVPSNISAALGFASISLRYPGSMYLTAFLYKVAEFDQTASDQFYRGALAAYANRPMTDFLYLATYPFGETRSIGDVPDTTLYRPPPTFHSNQALQRLFIQTLLARAQQVTQDPEIPTTANRLPDSAQIWLALTQLEKQIQASLPDLSEAALLAKANIYPHIPQSSQRRASQMATPPSAPRTFAEQVEAAEKQSDPATRERNLSFAITGAAATESLDALVSAAEKIDDLNVRQQLLDWLYFEHTQRALKDKNLAAAQKLASKVQSLDQRAYLYSRIAEEAIKHVEGENQARELLEGVVTATAKAPPSETTARALFSAAYLFTKIDLNRSISLIAEAVKVINRIKEPDFSRDYVTRRIEGKNFASFASFRTPGFNLQTAFQEVGKLDFDGLMYEANNLSDKFLRATTTLALVEPCLERTAEK